MLMPEASVHEKRGAIARKKKVGIAWKIAAVKPKPHAALVKLASYG